MYSVNFIFKNCASALSFAFKAHKNASELHAKGQRMLISLERPIGVIDAEDDYDQKASIDMNTVAAVSMGDVEKELERQGEVGILQAKAQMRAQSLANSDAGLRMLSENNKPSTILKGH